MSTNFPETLQHRAPLRGVTAARLPKLTNNCAGRFSSEMDGGAKSADQCTASKSIHKEFCSHLGGGSQGT